MKHVDLSRAYIVMIVSTIKNREERLYGKYKWAYHRHGTGIEDVIVRLAEVLLMVTDKTPCVKRCDRQWVIAAKYICNLHDIPRSGEYLSSQQSQLSISNSSA